MLILRTSKVFQSVRVVMSSTYQAVSEDRETLIFSWRWWNKTIPFISEEEQKSETEFQEVWVLLIDGKFGLD